MTSNTGPIESFLNKHQVKISLIFLALLGALITYGSAVGWFVRGGGG